MARRGTHPDVEFSLLDKMLSIGYGLLLKQPQEIVNECGSSASQYYHMQSYGAGHLKYKYMIWGYICEKAGITINNIEDVAAWIKDKPINNKEIALHNDVKAMPAIDKKDTQTHFTPEEKLVILQALTAFSHLDKDDEVRAVALKLLN